MLRDFLEIPYDTLEEMNLHAKRQRLDRVSVEKVREEREKYLKDTKQIIEIQFFSDTLVGLTLILQKGAAEQH